MYFLFHIADLLLRGMAVVILEPQPMAHAVIIVLAARASDGRLQCVPDRGFPLPRPRVPKDVTELLPPARAAQVVQFPF